MQGGPGCARGGACGLAGLQLPIGRLVIETSEGPLRAVAQLDLPFPKQPHPHRPEPPTIRTLLVRLPPLARSPPLRPQNHHLPIRHREHLDATGSILRSRVVAH